MHDQIEIQVDCGNDIGLRLDFVPEINRVESDVNSQVSAIFIRATDQAKKHLELRYDTSYAGKTKLDESEFSKHIVGTRRRMRERTSRRDSLLFEH